MEKNRLLIVAGVAAVALFAACSGGEGGASTDAASSASASPTTSGASGPAAAPTGKVIVVKLITDDAGSRFEPAKVEAHRGDVIRYTLTVGVHNVNFLPDSNPGKPGMPAASDMLQLPGQTFDLPVNFEEGEYYFQCDPHAALGMIGHLEVED